MKLTLAVAALCAMLSPVLAQESQRIKLIVERDGAIQQLRDASGNTQRLRTRVIQIDVELARIDERAGNIWWDRLAEFRDPLTRQVDYGRVLNSTLPERITTWQGVEVLIRGAVSELGEATEALDSRKAESIARLSRSATVLNTLLERTGTQWGRSSWVEAEIAEAVDRVRTQARGSAAEAPVEQLRATFAAGSPGQPVLVRGPETVQLVSGQAVHDWAAMARHGVKVSTRSQATAALEAGTTRFEQLARLGTPQALKELRTVTEALHELRYSVREYGWRYEWVASTYEGNLEGLKQRLSPLSRDGKAPFVEQLERLRWVGNELPAWIREGVVEETARRVAARAGPKAARLTAKVHPGLVAAATFHPEGELFGEAAPRELTFSQRFVNEVYEASRALPRGQRALFQQQVFGFMTARVAVHVEGNQALDVDTLVREATGAEIIPEAKRLGTRTELELDRRGKISRDGRRVIAENAVKRARRLAWESKVKESIAALDAARLANGRLNWARVREAGTEFRVGFGKFLLAIFLKELATGIAENDSARIKELYSEMGVLGLFKEYGLFMAGAAGGGVLYTATLEKHVAARSPILSGVVRSNLALATGLALPKLVRGEGLDRAYAISLASLGLSAAAVEGVLGLIPGVKRLRTASRLVGVTRAFRFGGWLYQGAELALVLTVGEYVDRRWTESLRRGELLDALEASAASLAEAEGEAFDPALEDYLARWDDWREFLLRPAVATQARFHEDMGRAARFAQLDESQVSKATELAKSFPGLPLGKFAEQVGASEASAADFTRAGERYQTDLDAALEEAYHGERRQGDLSAQIEGHGFAGAHQEASPNRLQAYEDQRAALAWLRAERGDGVGLRAAFEILDAMELLDRGLVGDDALRQVELPTQGPGAEDVLRDALKGE